MLRQTWAATIVEPLGMNDAFCWYNHPKIKSIRNCSLFLLFTAHFVSFWVRYELIAATSCVVLKLVYYYYSTISSNRQIPIKFIHQLVAWPLEKCFCCFIRNGSHAFTTIVMNFFFASFCQFASNLSYSLQRHHRPRRRIFRTKYIMPYTNVQIKFDLRRVRNKW